MGSRPASSADTPGAAENGGRRVSSLALSNMRAVTILIVLAFHSVLAYLDFLPDHPYRFEMPPWEWQAFAIIDARRFIGFDLFCAWQDVCLMSIFFFLSGLFVWPSLLRKGATRFLFERLMRIGVPCLLVVLVLMPVAYYPAFRVGAADASIEAYWRAWLALPFWPCGPQWFLWELIALNLVAALLHIAAPRWGEQLAEIAAIGRERPVRFFAGLAALSFAAYLPLALVSPWKWQHFGILAFQICRPLHYAVFFFAGVAVGAYGIERGLVAADGPLSLRWQRWVAAAFAGFIVWLVPTSFIVGDDNAPLWLQVAAAAGFVLGCATGAFGFFAVFLRFARQRRRFLDSLSANAYGMYLNHYVFTVWLQFALLGSPLPGLIKGMLVFVLTLAISWPLAAYVPRLMPNVRFARPVSQ